LVNIDAEYLIFAAPIGSSN